MINADPKVSKDGSGRESASAPFPSLSPFISLTLSLFFFKRIDFVIALGQESGSETGCPPTQDVTSELLASQQVP